MTTEEILTLARETIQQEAQAIAAIAGQLDVRLGQVAELLLACTGHVLISGVGTSHAVAWRLAHLLSCAGTPALFIHPADSLHGSAGAITAHDVVLAISKGGETDEINKFVAIARSRGAKIVGLTERPQSTLGQQSDLVLQVVAPPDIDPYGMIATGSSLVNAAIGDALCVVLLHLRGYSREQFGQTHPGGAVGKRLANEQTTIEGAPQR